MTERTVYRALIATSRKQSFLMTMKDLLHEGEIDDYIVLEAPE